MTFETCVKFHCTCSCCRTWRQRGALENFVQMCPMYVCMCTRVCVCVASGISSCLATIWVSLAGTVRAAEATHETCLLINTTMNHFTLPARGEWAGKMPLFRFICICVCMFVCIYVGICIVHMYVCVVHYSVLCSLLLLQFFGFLLRFLWFVCDFHASFRLVCSFAFELRYKQAHRHSHTHTHAHLHAHSHTFLSHAPLALFLSVFRTICVIRALASLGDLPQPTRTFVPLLLGAVCVAVLVATPRGGERHVSLINTHKIHKFQNLDLCFYCIFKLWKYVCTHFSYLSHISYKISGYICCMPNRHRKCAVGMGARGNFDRVLFHFDCTLKIFHFVKLCSGIL